MSLPSFLCIGAQKAGTSWLFEMLSQHPGIWMPPIKELHYFDHLFVEENRRWTAWHIQKSVRASAKWSVNNAAKFDLEYLSYLVDIGSKELFTEQWYRRAFSRPAARNKTLGDVTPEYCMLPEQGIEYVRRVLGAVKIIYMVREPVDRALSQLRMNLERRDPALPVDKDSWIKAVDSPDIFSRGDYANYIPRWRAQFAECDLLFVPFREINREPLNVIRRIEAFLGLSTHEQYRKLDERVHATKPINVPSYVVESLKERLGPQTEFLKKTFGEDFYRAT